VTALVLRSTANIIEEEMPPTKAEIKELERAAEDLTDSVKDMMGIYYHAFNMTPSAAS
jgi:tetrahydromethanopterin S-methyltransferase subunit B